jgi:GntR family transcriptional regulator/MocR family aminotransferase
MAKPAVSSFCIRLDRQPGETLQTQIYLAIRHAIVDGLLKPGSRLVSSRALATDLGVSRTTTLLALEQLIAEGYLVSRRGSGTYVADELPDDVVQTRPSRPPSEPQHPPVSRRSIAIAAIPPPAWRRAGPGNRPFRLGVPALDLFPIRLWAQLVTRRLRSVTLSQLDYGDMAGLPALREAIAAHVSSARGTRCRADQVIVVAGAQRGLELISDVLLDYGDEAWMEEPGYQGARGALVTAGARIVPMPVDQDGLDVDALAQQAGNPRLVYVTPSHQFPLGVRMSLPRRLALLRWASTARTWIIEDDYDSEFRYGAGPVTCLHGLDPDGRVIYVGSFSKTLFPSLRLGFLIVPSDLRDNMIAARRAGDIHPPAIDQAALADLIAEGHFDRHLRRMRSAYRERLEALMEAAEHFCSGVLRMRPVQTGMHAVADLESVSAERVFWEAAARGVEVMPLSAYFFGPRNPLNALLMGFSSMPPEALRSGMEQLAAAIDASTRPSTLRLAVSNDSAAAASATSLR